VILELGAVPDTLPGEESQGADALDADSLAAFRGPGSSVNLDAIF
jgi:hypothetical protein